MPAHAKPGAFTARAESGPAVSALIDRFRRGRWPVFRQLITLDRVGTELVAVGEWRCGGYAVVFWSLTKTKLRWKSYETKEQVYAYYEQLSQAPTPAADR